MNKETELGRTYTENRTRYFENEDILLVFGFITRCYDRKVRNLILDFQDQFKSFDVIMINSALWDINRWGPNGIKHFKSNIFELLNHLKKDISKSKTECLTQGNDSFSAIFVRFVCVFTSFYAQSISIKCNCYLIVV